MAEEAETNRVQFFVYGSSTPFIDNAEDVGNMEGWRFLKPSILNCKALAGKDIIVYNCHGSYGAAREFAHKATEYPEMAFIAFWGMGSLNEETSVTVNIVNGIRIPGGACDGVGMPSDAGSDVEIVFSTENTPIAYRQENVIWVLFDLPHWYNAKAGEIMEYILAGLTFGSAIRPTKPERMVQKAMARRKKELMASALNNLAYAESVYRPAKSAVYLLRRKICTQRHIREEIEKIAKIDKVESVVMSPRGRIDITTAPLSIEHEGIEYNIGAYTFALPAMPRRMFQFVPPRVAPRLGTIHPHISADGYPCFPQQVLSLQEPLFMSGRLCELTMLLLDFLQTYTAGDAHARIQHWPTVVRPPRASVADSAKVAEVARLIEEAEAAEESEMGMSVVEEAEDVPSSVDDLTELLAGPIMGEPSPAEEETIRGDVSNGAGDSR